MNDMLEIQYRYVCDARAVLFRYCATITPEDFNRENDKFGNGGSIKSLLVHIVNVYQIWIAEHALQLPTHLTSPKSVPDISSAQSVFKEVDGFMNQFIQSSKEDISATYPFKRNGAIQTASALMFFTHVITHEFHHKGQILSLSRHLGYKPADTDVIH